MLAIDLIQDFRKIIKEGPEDLLIPSRNILKVLESYEKDLGEDALGSEANLARIQHYYNRIEEHQQRTHEVDMEIFRAANQSGQTAIRSVFLINGGAAIAISAFIGTVASAPNSSIAVKDFALPLALFSVGAFSSSLSYATTYLTQFTQGYQDEYSKWRSRLATAFNGSAIFFGAIGLACFAIGLFQTYHTMV